MRDESSQSGRLKIPWSRWFDVDDHLRVGLAIWCVITTPILVVVGWFYRPAILLAVCQVVWGWVFWKDARRGFLRRRWRREGRCLRCGYDLTGNVSGRCPECGESIGSEGAGSDARGGGNSS